MFTITNTIIAIAVILGVICLLTSFVNSTENSDEAAIAIAEAYGTYQIAK